MPWMVLGGGEPTKRVADGVPGSGPLLPVHGWPLLKLGSRASISRLIACFCRAWFSLPCCVLAALAVVKGCAGTR